MVTTERKDDSSLVIWRMVRYAEESRNERTSKNKDATWALNMNDTRKVPHDLGPLGESTSTKGGTKENNGVGEGGGNRNRRKLS